MRKSLMSKIYTEMKVRIVSGQFPPDMILTEAYVAQEFGSSKTPAREAMALLTQEGYLLRFQGKGYIVRSIDSNELREMQLFRRTIEVAVLAQIIEYSPDTALRSLRDSQKRLLDHPEETKREMNIEFHIALAKLSRNRFFVESIERAMTDAARGYYRMYQEQVHQEMTFLERLPVLVRNHIAIIDALLAHDIEDAVSALDRDYDE